MHRRRETYIGHSCLCLSVCPSLVAFPHSCMDPDVTWGNSRGALWLCTIGWICNRCTGFVALTTYKYISLQSYRLQMHIARNAKCQRVLVLTLWLVGLLFWIYSSTENLLRNWSGFYRLVPLMSANKQCQGTRGNSKH